MDISQKILLTRKQKGFTQESLAGATNLSLSTIQRIENGKVVPRAHTLKALSDVLGIELNGDQLLNRNGANDDANDLDLFLLLSIVLVFVPPLNIVFLLGIWVRRRQNGLLVLSVRKVLRFQLTSFIILVLSSLLIPLMSYLLTGQKSYGQLNAALFIYVGFVIVNMIAAFVIRRTATVNELKTV